jgi:hypothetical protein
MLVKHHAQGKFYLIACPEGSRIVRRSGRIAPRGRFLPDLIIVPFGSKATGSTYFTYCSVACGLMVMSYFGRVAERCRRASIPFISLAGTRTPSGYVPWRRFTVG